MKLRKIIAGIVSVIVAPSLAFAVVFIVGVDIPIPRQTYAVSDFVQNWTAGDEIDLEGYFTRDRDGQLAVKLRLSSRDYKPLLQRALDRAIPKGKVAKETGVRVWLDEVTLNSAIAAGANLRTSTRVKGRIVNDVSGTDHKDKEVGITFDVGVDDVTQTLIVTCQIGNISSFPGDAERLMNSGCSMRIPICELSGGLEVHDVGYQFIGDANMLGVEVVGRVRVYGLVLNRLKRAFGMAAKPLTCAGKTYAV